MTSAHQIIRRMFRDNGYPLNRGKTVICADSQFTESHTHSFSRIEGKSKRKRRRKFFIFATLKTGKLVKFSAYDRRSPMHGIRLNTYADDPYHQVTG